MKMMDSRPSSLAKFFSSGSGQELGNTSSSEGEKDSPPPEWDSVPIHKEGSCKYPPSHGYANILYPEQLVLFALCAN